MTSFTMKHAISQPLPFAVALALSAAPILAIVLRTSARVDWSYPCSGAPPQPLERMPGLELAAVLDDDVVVLFVV